MELLMSIHLMLLLKYEADKLKERGNLLACLAVKDRLTH